MTPDTFDPANPPKPDNVVITYINASQQRVWKALTDPTEQATYFGGKTEIGEQGGRWIRHATDKWPALSGDVLVKDKPSRLLLTWGHDANPPPDWIEFLVEPAANGTTRVTIREYHARDWGDDYAEAAEQGWAALLSGLKTIVETGKPLPSPF
jgi:uncharacterized protein YndB with AHSA1/START domain